MELIDAIRYHINMSSLSCSQRAYWRRAPERATTPYLVFTEMQPKQPLHVHDGTVGTIQRSVQFAVFETSQSAASALSKALRQYFDGFSGLMGPTGNTCEVRSALWEGQWFWNYEDDTKLHMEVVDIKFQYYE